MNILGIVGSVRKESIHKQILKHYKEIAKDYFELSEGSIVELPMFDGENTDNTAVVKLAEQVANADGVIFFSPEYNYSIPGSLKNALDHLSIVSSQPFVGKPAAIVGASPGAAGTAALARRSPPLRLGLPSTVAAATDTGIGPG